MVDDNDSPPPSSSSSYVYLSSLPEPLRGFSIKALVPPHRSNGENCQEGGDSIARPELAGAASSPAAAASFATSEKLDEFEIATRSHLLSLAENLLLTSPTSSSSPSQETQQKEGEECAKIDTLLQYLKNVTLLCLHVVKHHAASATNPPPSPLSDTNKTSNCTDNYSHLSTTLPLKKLPFLLMEDAFDTLPLTIIQTLWSSTKHANLNLSSYATSLLCSPTIFVPPSKFVLLRICNKLLKQLSNQKAEDAEFAGSIMILLAKVFPLSERSAVNVLGSYNVRKSTKPQDILIAATESASFLESGEGSNQESSTLAAGEKTGPTEGKSKPHDTNDSVIGYEFYKTFWGVQKVFTDPLGTILPSQLSQSTAAADAYGVFMKDVTSILMALESTPIAKVSPPSSKTSIANDDDTSLSSRHHKYLTSRQLLHLQLKDAQLRVHFLTQLLIVLSHLASPNVTLPVPSLATDGSKATMQARVVEQTKQLSQVEKRAMELLRSTVSSSSSGTMCRFLLWILKDRESMWRAWKRAKCMPALDKVGNATVSGSLIQGILAGEKKRKAEAASLDDCTDSGKRRVDASSGGIIQNSSLSDMTDQNTQSIPTLESFLTPYVEALDPENGIEGEYHPRNDKVYCWRALRLMARDQNHQGQLCRFGKLRRRDGDFEGIVRDMWKAEKEGEEIGGTMIDVEYYADEIDLNDNMAHEMSGGGGGVSNGDNDAEMLDDAASVGTPEEDVEARKEKMAEFERAAMEVEETLLNEEKDEENKDQIETSAKQHVGEESKGNASVKSVAVVVKDNGVPGKFVANNASTKAAAKHSKVEETNEGVVSSNQKGSAVVADQSKGKINNANKSELSKGKVIATVSSSIGNDPSSSHKVDQKKDEQKKTETNASAQGRPKFTPPQKKQQQQHTQPQPNEKSRDGARGRFVGRKDNADQVLPQHQPKQQQPQKQVQQQQQGRIQPPHNQDQRSGGRDDGSSRSAHQRGSSTNDAGRRDGKSQSPLSNNTNDGGPPLGGRGSVGLGNKGKGGWEPPPPQGGGGNGRGTGGGVEGHGGSFRGRRQGGGGRR